MSCCQEGRSGQGRSRHQGCQAGRREV